MIVQKSTLKIGQYLVAGTVWAKVKAIRDENSKPLHEASLSTPVELYGWKSLPEAGDFVIQVAEEWMAKELVGLRELKKLQKEKHKSIEIMNEKKESEYLTKLKYSKDF